MAYSPEFRQQMKDLLQFRLSGVIFGPTQFAQSPSPSEKEEAMRKSKELVAMELQRFNHRRAGR